MEIAGTVVSLHIAPAGGARMQTLQQVKAVTGRGLEGDRYFSTLGTYSNRPGAGRHVTLIEVEAIERSKGTMLSTCRRLFRVATSSRAAWRSSTSSDAS